MRWVTYKYMMIDISRANKIPVSTLETFPISTIIGTYRNLFGGK